MDVKIRQIAVEMPVMYMKLLGIYVKRLANYKFMNLFKLHKLRSFFSIGSYKTVTTKVAIVLGFTKISAICIVTSFIVACFYESMIAPFSEMDFFT